MKTNILIMLFAFTKMLLHFGEVNGLQVRQVEVGIDDDLSLSESVSDKEFGVHFQ